MNSHNRRVNFPARFSKPYNYFANYGLLKVPESVEMIIREIIYLCKHISLVHLPSLAYLDNPTLRI